MAQALVMFSFNQYDFNTIVSINVSLPIKLGLIFNLSKLTLRKKFRFSLISTELLLYLSRFWASLEKVSCWKLVLQRVEIVYQARNFQKSR